MKNRAYCFTCNNYDRTDISRVMELTEDHKLEYLIVGYEVGKKGTPHLQGYMYFHNARHIGPIKKQLQGFHIEIAKGSPQQNKDYCSKDGDIYEHGELPQQGKACYQNVKEAMRNPHDNYHTYHQYRKSYEELQLMSIRKRTLKKIEYILEDDIYELNPEETYTEFDLRQYNGEKNLVIYSNKFHQVLYENKEFDVIKWYRGFTPRISRGYQIIHINPEIVYLIYTSENHLKELQDKYSILEPLIVTDGDL